MTVRGPVDVAELGFTLPHEHVTFNSTMWFQEPAEARKAAIAELTFIASAGGLHGAERFTAYGSSKFGVVGLTRCIGRELARRRIRVNAVRPSGVHTPMSERTITGTAERLGEDRAKLRAKLYDEVPIGRYAEHDEVASVCVFRASPLAAHIAGAALPVDGAQGA
jgi:NAD(P)-dependent dehydrogenase (short-subunit alcohol dehydrogenase family)